MTEMTQTPAVAPVAQANASSKSLSLVERMAERLNVESGKLWATLVQTCFKPNKDGEGFTYEEVMLILLIAEQLNLNPLRREIWAFRGNGGVQPIVSIDGWKAIMLRQPSFDGYEVRYSETLVEIEGLGKLPEWAECTIWLKGISHPTTERVYLSEVFMSSSPVWRKSPRRMLHHRALIQAIRFSFQVTGISDVAVGDDGSMIDGSDLMYGSVNVGQVQPNLVRAIPAKPAKLVTVDKERFNEIAEKAITMARSRNDYVPAFKFAETLEATARDYVKGRLQEARDADLRAAMMTAEPSESGGDVESFFNAVDAQEVPQPCMDAFA